MTADDYAFQLFLEVYGTLHRAGPGGDVHTQQALSLLPGSAPERVLDLGCGPGAQTVVLASSLSQASILGVDKLPSMVAEATARLTAAGLDDRAQAAVGDMAIPPVEAGSQDLIWCEGAIYHVGVTNGLRTWQPLLRSNGTAAFTEPVWLVDSPPTEVYDWWTSEYPAITDAAGVRAQITAASYETCASFVLPASAWWDDYYAPMQDRVTALQARLPDDPIAHQVVAAAKTEIDYFVRFSDCYSYQFFIVQPGA